MYNFETKTNEKGEIENIINHQPEGYNARTGIYASSYIFQGDWEDELSALNFTRRGDKFTETSKIDAEKGQDTQYLYNSFRNKLHATINQDDGLDIVDTLNPNVTYYYTFRSIDRHDQPSNPSQIYEITLSYSSGVFIPKISIYNSEKAFVENKKPTKKMSRFIEIKGADIQTLVNEQRGPDFELINSEKGFIPDQENQITANKFLVRLTSKDSGRKISFLIDFTER